MPVDTSDSNSRANKPAIFSRPRLINGLNLLALVLAVSLVLVLLYPRQRLLDQIRANKSVDDLSVQYMRNLLATQPDNWSLRLILAQDNLALGKYQQALATLQPLLQNSSLQHSSLWENALLLKLNILTNMLWATSPNSPQRAIQREQLKQFLRRIAPLITGNNALSQLITLAENNGDNALADQMLMRLIHTEHNPEILAHTAEDALHKGFPYAAARLFQAALSASQNPVAKARYFNQMLSALESAGLNPIALAWLNQLPIAQRQQPDILVWRIKLALADNQPALADRFAVQLLAQLKTNTNTRNFVPTRPPANSLELIWTASLGNRDTSNALKTAQYALTQHPDSPVWHQRLAQVAEWSHQPQLALSEWRWLALHQNTAPAWQAWMRLAGGLFDYAAQILGLEHQWKQHQSGRRTPSNNQNNNADADVRKIVALYEYIGQPENAVAWLNNHIDENRHPDLLLLHAQLLERMGRDTDAIQYYQRYLAQHTVNPTLAVGIAGLMERAGQNQSALAVLNSSRPQAKPQDIVYWRNLGYLAWRMNNIKLAVTAWRVLCSSPGASNDDRYHLVLGLQRINPQAAADTASRLWQQTGDINLFLMAANIDATLSRWHAMQRLYQQLTPAQRDSYQQHTNFIALRAVMYQHNNEPELAAQDDIRLIQNEPGATPPIVNFLWLLIDTHHFNGLERYLRAWRPLLPEHRDLWEVFAAAYLTLDQPEQALALYRGLFPDHRQDTLWLLNYASVLEASNRPADAWRIRRWVWQQQLASKTRLDWLNSPFSEKGMESLKLLLLNDPLPGQGILWQLLRHPTPALRQNSQFVELATVWLNERAQQNETRIWLIRQYAHWLDTPLGARIADALTHHDAEAANRILQQHGAPPLDRMNLATVANNPSEAASLAFSLMQESPRDASLYEQAAPLLLPDDHTVTASTVWRSLDFYRESETSAAAGGFRVGGLKLDVHLDQYNRYAASQTWITRAPNETDASVILRDNRPNASNQLTLQIDQSLNTQLAAILVHQQQISPHLQLTGTLALNQRADEDPFMLLIGRRNRIELESDFQIDRWNQWTVDAALNRYHSIDNQDMGSGQTVSSALNHTFSNTHPALQGRLVATWMDFSSANTILTGKTASLIPAGQINNAAYFMPYNVHEIAAYLRVGDQTNSDLPARDFEYMGEFGLYYDPLLGAGYRAKSGLATKIFGADRLQFFFEYDEANQGQKENMLETGVSYVYHY